MLRGPERGIGSSITISSENTTFDVFDNFSGCNGRIGRSSDRSPNYKKIRAGSDRLRRSHDTFLILLLAPARANSGYDQFQAFANGSAQCADFLCADNKAADATFLADFCQSNDL